MLHDSDATSLKRTQPIFYGHYQNIVNKNKLDLLSCKYKEMKT